MVQLLDRYDEPLRSKLVELREAIFEVARDKNVGPVEETQKWGQPAYLTTSGSGTTIRIDRDETHGGALALHVSCNSSLVAEWRERFPGMVFGGERSVHLALDADLSDPRLRMCIADALTYHRRKKNTGRG